MTDKFTDLMVDIETLGKVPGVVVLSIGLCAFNRYGLVNGLSEMESVTLRLSILPQTARGLVIDPDTMLWWMNQSAEARSDWASDEAQMTAGLPSDQLFVMENWINSRCIMTPWAWANSPQFDFSILQPLYRIAGRSFPWAYWQERDIRTLGAVHSDVKRPKPALAHSAASDAEAQALWVQRIFAKIAGKDANVEANDPDGPVLSEPSDVRRAS
ncbi:MAG: ATPase [Candidatus Saccharibacteria bacterium]|nr:ATPase [Candidatus Saccharibacteria bacterium]MDB5716413.1 ATPase [Sphingomonadales bacterium]